MNPAACFRCLLIQNPNSRIQNPPTEPSMPRSVVRKRRVTALIYDVESYRAVFDPIRQRYPDLEWDIRTRNSLGADSTNALMRELASPWTSISIFPIHLREMSSLIERGWLREVGGALPPQTRARYAPA